MILPMSRAGGAYLFIDSISIVYQTRDGQGVQAVKEFTLGVDSGEFVSLVGPSGCGKSSIIKTVAGIQNPTMGKMELAGRPIAGPSIERPLVFQQYALFPWKTVQGNVEFGLKSLRVPKDRRRRKVQEMLELVGLSDFADKYPHQLSGGMQQRCALARVLAVDPAVLLMDEPLAAVDAQTRVLMQDELLRIWGEAQEISMKKVALYVTHDISEAVYLSDRIAVMSSRPGQLKKVVTVELPRPRDFSMRASAEFGRRVEEVWNLIRSDLTIA